MRHRMVDHLCVRTISRARVQSVCLATRHAVAVAFSACVLAAVAQAQERVASTLSHPARPAPFDSIQLTTAQRAAIDADWQQRRAALSTMTERMRRAGRISEEDRTAMRAFAEARNAAVRAILTPAQRTILDRNLQRITEARRSAPQTGGTPR